MRVLLVNDLPPGPGGGVEVHIERLVRGLQDAGDEVDVFAGRIAHTGPRKVLDIWDPWARRELRSVVERWTPDVVHFHNVVRELSVSVLGAAGSTASVMTVHDHRILGIPDRHERRALALAKGAKAALDRAISRRRLEALIAVSETLAASLRAAGFPEVHCVPVFVSDEPPPAHPPSACHDVLFAGRLVPNKGVLLLVDAFRRVAEKYPSSRLLLAGDGELRGELEDLAERSDGRIRLLGMLDEEDLRDTMRGARLVASPSYGRLEGSSMTSVEAALAARPLIVSDDPAMREIVEGGGGGLVVPRETVNPLADALDRLLGRPDEADILGRRARSHARRRHTTGEAVTATRRVYRRARELAGAVRR